MIGSSYLIADTAGASGLASDAQNLEVFTLRDSVAADFAIDGGDATKINVLTDCWAILVYLGAAAPDTATLTVVDSIITSLPTLPNQALGSAFQELEATIGADGWYPLITTPPVSLPAGTALSANLHAKTSAGTWSNLGGNAAFQIVRVS